MNARMETIEKIEKHSCKKDPFFLHSAQFGSRVLALSFLEKTLSQPVYQHFLRVGEGKETFDPAYADAIASAIRDWAVQEGATHFTHWFQPLTEGCAEKHDSFLSRSANGTVIEAFRGKDLLLGEPDASSFPSGGLRATHAARGYTVWDSRALPFLWEGGGGVTLCIPSLFFSWTGESLDHKIALLRSEEKIQSAALRLLRFCNIEAQRVDSTLGIEQEYFLIDRHFFLLRPDLLLAGRTVYGAASPKSQELEDHYFGPLKDRVLAFMRAFENRAIRLGIPVKTRHNEVAPAQHEIAPLFEKASTAVDHNLLLMELMRCTAIDHGLACLFHEKPFAKINGSGKHNNWSLATDRGLNLLDPRENSVQFLILLTAILRAVHDHSALMRASIGSAGNDHRLGGSEAPPTILSVYLGSKLEKLVDHLIEEKPIVSDLCKQIDLQLMHLPALDVDVSDRNRTSFFAFTGNKFEFRAVGSSAHCALPMTVINAITADSLHLILDEIADVVKERALSQEELLCAALPVLRGHLRKSRAVVFGGNAYSVEWEREAQQRGLPNIRKSFHAFSALLEPRTARVFSGILTETELHSRYEILVERYVKTVDVEAKLMIELFRTQILPAALADLRKRSQACLHWEQLHGKADSLLSQGVHRLAESLKKAIQAVDAIEKIQGESIDFGWEAKARVYAELLGQKMGEAREEVDRLETMVDNALWPLPKYREMLFIG